MACGLCSVLYRRGAVQITYLVNGVYKSLGFFATETSCNGNPVWGVHEGPDARDGVGRGHVCRMEAIVEDGGYR